MTLQHQDEGVEVFLSQPVFEEVDTCLDRIDLMRWHGLNRPILHDIFALKSYEDARYCEERFGLRILKR